MADRDDGGPAFPRPASPPPATGLEWAEDGMTLRDWFAGQALVGMAPVVCKPGCQYEPQDGDPRSVEEFTAAVVYSLADAMLAERAKVERGQAPNKPAAATDALIGGSLDTGAGIAAQPAPASVPRCRSCGLHLGSERPYCDVCGCGATCAEGVIRCRMQKGHDGRHVNGGVSWVTLCRPLGAK